MNTPRAAEPPPDEPARRRWWRWPLGLGLVALLLLGLAVSLPWFENYLVASRGKAELAAVLAEIERADPRWRWEQLDEERLRVPADDNSIRVLRESAAALDGWAPESCTLPNGDALLEEQHPPNRRLDDERLACLRGALAKREPAVALALSLRRYPRGRSDVDLAPDYISTPLPDGATVRTVTALLDLEIERLVHAGRGVDAAEGIGAMLHAGAVFRDLPEPISQLARLSCRRSAVLRTERLLGMGEIPAETCRRLQAHLAAERDEMPLVPALRGERAARHYLFVNLEEGQVSLPDLFVKQLGETTSVGEDNTMDVRALANKYRPRLFADHAADLRILHLACTIARLPTWEQPDAWEAYRRAGGEARVEAMDLKRNVLTALMLTALNRIGEKALRDQALLSCAVVALAAEQFRLKEKRWPESPNDLTPAFLDKLPPDPYTGKPPLYTRGAEGIRVSCVDHEGKDVAVQVWNADRRGLPPLPPNAAGNPP